MGYEVALNDDVVERVVRFDRAHKAAWDRCLRELRSDPWERATADIRIIAQPQPDPFEAERYFFIAT